MNAGKTLFAQIMELVPWKASVVLWLGTTAMQVRAGCRPASCFVSSQLTWRESLRDIEACVAANPPKLFHMGLRSAPARSTLADALNRRDWRIYQALALQLIARISTPRSES